MALSQVQCLDENHVNPRTHESKPDFLYCEDQRLALELYLRDGRAAFDMYLEARGLRGFLSDPELESLVGAVEPYDPGSEVFAGNAEDGERPMSLHYWPELSDTSVPQMDLGWPDSESYRGVTRTTVYTQPPLEGQAHIKEVVRKMIAQAQKVIAVVMDVFTDVDIFRDLLDAGFKRKVSVYVLLEHTTLPHFLSMCQRANVHSGHLKLLRVRCSEGTEFYTRSCTKVKGRMGHRFMFVDGDKAVSGSYSFTWMSSRLDRNLITVVTGQAVDAFDRLFRLLYVSSSSVDLRAVATEPEPEPEPLPQPAALVLPSAALARKLHNPKYALVAVASPSPSADHSSPKEKNPGNFKNPNDPETNKRKQKRASKEAIQDAPPLHPGLVDLEKASLIAYLPTWPEPDPPSDVIGFINIRDAKKPTQVHLQRSEMFETSQAIRFSSPITVPKETLPEVAKPRQPIAKHEEKGHLQPTQGHSKAEESLVDNVPAQLSAEPGDGKRKEEATEQKNPVSERESERANDTTETNQGPGHNTTSITLPQSPNNQGPTDSSPKPEAPPQSKIETNTQSDVPEKLPAESNGTPPPHTHAPPDSTSNTEQHTLERTGLPLTNSHTPPLNTSEMPPKNQAPALDGLISSGMCPQSFLSTCPSENTHIPVTANSAACAPPSSIVASSSIDPVISSSTTLHPPPPSSSAPLPLTPTPPIPKPRTVQLVVTYDGTNDGQNPQNISVISMTESLSSTGQLVHSKLNGPSVVQTPLENEPEPLQEVHNRKLQPQEDGENTGNLEEAPQQKPSVASQETRGEEAVELCDTAAETQAQPDALIADAPKAGGENVPEIIPKEAEPDSLISAAYKMTSEAAEKSPTDCEIAQAPNEENNNVTQHKPHHPEPQDNGPLETVNSLKAPVNVPVCNESADNSTSVTSTPRTDSKSDTKHNLQQSSQQTSKPRGGSHTPERPLRLYLSDTHIRDLRSPTPEREPGSLAILARTPTPDGLPLQTPDTLAHTLDFRTPTPDVSDGYVSPREDSTLSTTSDEYYECSDSPSHDPVSDCVGTCNQGKAEDHVRFTHTHTANATTVTTTSTSPACINNSAQTSTVGTADRNNSSSATKVSSGTEEEEETVNEQNGRRNVAERRTEQDSQGNVEAKRPADPLKQARDLTEAVDKVCEPQSPQRKKAVNKLATEVLVDRVTRGASEGTDPKQPSTGGLKPDSVSPQGERPATEMAVDKAALRPGGVDKRDRAQPAAESGEQKLSHGHQQLESGMSSPARRPRAPRPLSATQPLGTRPSLYYQLTEAESRGLHSSLQVSDDIPSHRRSPQAQGAVWTAAGQKQAKVPQSQHSLLSQQPLAAQGRAKVERSQNQHPTVKPQLSLLLAHANVQPELRPRSQNQAVPGREAHKQEEGTSPFSITFGRLYSLKGLKDKMSKLPAHSRRGGTSSPLQGHKGSS